MADVKKNLYNIALESQGYLLSSLPKGSARKVDQAPVYGNRFATGDKDYLDFTFWWFWAQTDWSGGFKDEKKWRDDAKYYYLTNLDAFSEYGAIKLASSLILKETFTENIHCSGYGLLNSDIYHFIGTDDSSSNIPMVYQSTDGITFVESTTITGKYATTRNYVCFSTIINGSVWVGTNGVAEAAPAGTLVQWDTHTTTDHSAGMKTAFGTGNLIACYSITNIAADIYVAVKGVLTIGILKYSEGSWTKLVSFPDNQIIFDMINYGGNIYYLKGVSNSLVELRVYDISASADSLVQEFKNDYLNENGGAGKYLQVLNGKLIITIPDKEIWSYDGSTLTRIWLRDDTKNTIGTEAVGFIRFGGIYHDYKLWWGNLMYDGFYFFNYKKDITDSTTNVLYPIYSDKTNIRWVSATDAKKLYADSGYKSGTDKNFIVFSEISEISTVEKLAHSLTIIFEKLLSGQNIKIYYSIDGGANYLPLGTVSEAVDGGSVTKKTFYFPEDTTFEKMFLKAYLNGGGSNTPTLKDTSMAYLPLPDYKQRWILNLQCYNNMMLLDGKMRESKRGEELKNILKTNWWSEKVLDFQDVDYAETLLNGDLAASGDVTIDSTAKFPEQGRIKIEQEEILYTARTATKFTGCTRGARGTVAASHSDDTVVSNGYKIIITGFAESVPIGIEPKIGEYVVALELREV